MGALCSTPSHVDPVKDDTRVVIEEVPTETLKQKYEEHVGKPLNDEDLERLRRQYDDNGDGKIDAEEFNRLVSEEKRMYEQMDQATQMFQQLDADNSGYLDMQELGKLFEAAGISKTEEEVKQIAEKDDTDGDASKISKEEFLKILKDEIVDLSELQSTLQVLKNMDSVGYKYRLKPIDVTEGTGALMQLLTKLAVENAGDLENLSGNEDEESFRIWGVVLKLVQDWCLADNPTLWSSESQTLLEEDPLELVKKISASQWDWKVQQAGLPDPFAESSALFHQLKEKYGKEKVSEIITAVIEECQPQLSEMEKKFGASFCEMYANIFAGLVCWDSSLFEEKAIKKVGNGAIFAFSFGTGNKIGQALENPTLVGPGYETPGKTNEGLAEEIRKILKVKPMPVFAQWEIADALLYGGDGAPMDKCESFASWEFGEGREDSSRYQKVEDYQIPGTNNTVKVFKSLPIWPMAIQQGLVRPEDLSDGTIMRKFYLSTVGVLEQNRAYWEMGETPKPSTAIVVAHVDHAKRCKKLIDDLFLSSKSSDSGKETLEIEQSELPVGKFYPSQWDDFNCDQFGYDPVSTQIWTQKRYLFIAHEAAARNKQYVRGDFGPLPICEPETDFEKGHLFCCSKLKQKGIPSEQLFGMLEWD